MRRVLALALLAFSSGSAVAADPSVYSATYNTCLQRAQSTMDTVACITAETKLWDDVLNRNYQATVKTLTPERQNGLRDVQRKWIAWRDAKCGFIFDPNGGTITRIEAAQCLLDVTSERAVELDPNRKP